MFGKRGQFCILYHYQEKILTKELENSKDVVFCTNSGFVNTTLQMFADKLQTNQGKLRFVDVLFTLKCIENL